MGFGTDRGDADVTTHQGLAWINKVYVGVRADYDWLAIPTV
jgi:hypothetical protein